MQAAKPSEQTRPASPRTRASKLTEILRGLVDRKQQRWLLAALSTLHLRQQISAQGLRTRREALERIAQLKSILTRFSDQRLSEPSISLRRAFFRWKVRVDPSLARECVEKLIQCVTLKREVSVWRLMRLRDVELFRRKARFLAFVEKLVELTGRANAKIIHSHKNLFFFSLLLISARKEREDFNRRMGGFVRMANGRLAMKTTALLGALVPHNPRQSLVALLQRGALKRAHASLGALQLLAKKDRILASYKFIGVVNERLSVKTRATLGGLVPLRRKFINTLVEKLRLALRRTLKQLGNRALFLLSRKEGLGRFVAKLETVGSFIGVRNGFMALRRRLTAHRNVQRLSRQLDALEHKQRARDAQQTLSLLRQKVQLILTYRRQSIAKRLIKALKGKIKIALDGMRTRAHKVRLAQALFARRTVFSQREKAFAVLSTLKLINTIRGFTEAKEQQTRKHLAILYKIKTTRRWKLGQALQALRGYSTRLFERGCRFATTLLKVRKHLVATSFASIKRFALKSTTKSIVYSQRVLIMQTKLFKLHKTRLIDVIQLLRHLTLRSKTLLLALASFINKKNKATAQTVFLLFKQASLQRSVVQAEAQTVRVKQQNLLQLLTNKAQISKKSALQKLQAYCSRRKTCAAFLINALKRKTFVVLKLRLVSLQRNRQLYAHTTSQERRRANLIALAQSLLRSETRRKSSFLRLLQKHTQKAVLGRQLLRKFAESKYRQLIAAGLAKLVNHCRRGKLQEFGAILDKTTTDLSDVNRILRPKYHRAVLRRLFYGTLLNSYNSRLLNAFKQLRATGTTRRYATERLVSAQVTCSQQNIRQALTQLRKHGAGMKIRAFELNLRLWSLERLIRAKHILHKLAILRRLSRKQILRQMFGTLIGRVMGGFTKLSLQAALLRLKAFAITEMAARSAANRSQAFLKITNALRTIFDKRLASLQRDAFNHLKSRLIHQLLLKRLLTQVYKRLLSSGFTKLSKHQTTSLLAHSQTVRAEIKKHEPIYRLTYATNQKQGQVFQKLLRNIIKQKLTTYKKNNWTMLYFRRKTQILKLFLHFSNKFNSVFKQKKTKERIVTKLIFAYKTITLQFFARLRQASKKSKYLLYRFASKLNNNRQNRLDQAIAKLRQNALFGIGRNSSARHFLLAVDRTIKPKIALLQAAFLSKMRNIRQRDAITKLTASNIERMNFRRKAGAFIEKLNEHQIQSKLKFRVISQLRKSIELRLRHALSILQKLIASTKHKSIRADLLLSVQLSLRLKMKQRLAFSLLRRQVSGLSILKGPLTALNLNARLKKAQAFATLKKMRAVVGSRHKTWLRWFINRASNNASLNKKRCFDHLRSKTKRFENVGRRLAQALAIKLHKKKMLALQRLRNPSFRINEKFAATNSLISCFDRMQHSRVRPFIDKVKKLSPLFLFKTWSQQFQKIQELYNQRLLKPFLLIQQRAYNSNAGYSSDALTAARFVRGFIARRAGPDSQTLLHPCLLALLDHALPNRLEPAQRKRLSSVLNHFLGPKTEDSKMRESKSGLLEQMNALRLEAARLEAEKRHIAQNHQELEGLLLAHQTRQAALENAAGEFAGLEDGAPARKRLSRLVKDKRELEGLLGRYASETRSMEDELVRFEREEQSFLEKILGLQGEHLNLQQQFADNEFTQNQLHEENRQLRLDNSAVVGQVATLTREAKAVAEQLRGLEEEGRRVAGRESALQETNTSLQRRNQQLTDENAGLLERQKQLLSEREELLAANKALTAQAAALTAERERFIIEKEAFLTAERELRAQIMTRTESKSKLLHDNAYLLSQRSLQLGGQEDLLRQVGNQPSSRRKSALANEQLGSIFNKLKVIDDNINNNNQQIYSEEKEIQKAEGELREAASGIALADNRIRKLDARLDEVKTELGANAGKLETLSVQIVSGGGRVTQNNAQIDANGQLISENKALLEEIQATLLGLRQNEEDKTAKLTHSRLEIQNLNLTLDKKATKLVEGERAEVRNAEATRELERQVLASESQLRKTERQKNELTAEREQLRQQNLEILSEDETVGENLETQDFQSRHDLTRRMSELREQLEKAGRTLEEKHCQSRPSQSQSNVKDQNNVENKRAIVDQATRRLTSIQNLLDLNLQNIDAQVEQVRRNEAALAEKERRIARNQEELRRLSQRLEQPALPPAPTVFRQVFSKKVQTFEVGRSEARAQTELCGFDIANIERRATQKHVVRTLEPIAPKILKVERGVDARAEVAVQYFKKEAPKSFVMEEAVAPVIQRIRRMQREPSLRKDLPLANPDDPLNLPFLAKDRHLDRIDKLYDHRLEPATDERDVIGMFKRNPFVKIERFFFENKNERRVKSFNKVENISSYFFKNTEQGPPTPIARQFRDMIVNTDLDISHNVSFDIPRPEPTRPKMLISQGPAFSQAKIERIEKYEQNVYSILFPKSEVRVLPPLPSIRELVRVNDMVKETATNATQTELDPIAHLALFKLAGIFRARDAHNLQLAASTLKELVWPSRGLKPELSFTQPLRLFNNKKSQFQFQLKALRQRKNDAASRMEKVVCAILRRYLKTQWHHLQLISHLDTCKLYLNSLFRWKLQNIDFNHRKQLERIKSVHIGLDSIFSRLIYKRLGLAFRRMQRYQDQRQKDVYSRLFPLMFRADAAYKLNLRNALRYWFQIKDENRWYTKILRELVYKASLEPQIALWRLRFFKRPVKVTPPRVFAGATRLFRFFKDKEQRLIKECAAVLASLARVPSPDASGFGAEVQSPFTEESEPPEQSDNDEELSRANAKVLVLSIKTIFRTLDDRWKARKADVLARLRLQTLFAAVPVRDVINRPERVSSWPDEGDAGFLLQQNNMCKHELERKEKLLEELRHGLEVAKQDAAFLRNSFIYVVLNRIQCLIRKHAKESALPLKRAAFNSIKHNLEF